MPNLLSHYACDLALHFNWNWRTVKNRMVRSEAEEQPDIRIFQKKVKKMLCPRFPIMQLKSISSHYVIIKVADSSCDKAVFTQVSHALVAHSLFGFKGDGFGQLRQCVLQLTEQREVGAPPGEISFPIPSSASCVAY